MRSKNKLIKGTAFINGRAIESKKTFDVINPATGEIIVEVSDLSLLEAEKAIDIAFDKWPTWRTTDIAKRSEILRKWYNLIIKHSSELAEIMTLESGKPLEESKVEVKYGASFISWFAEEAFRAYGDQITPPENGKQIVTLRQSVGVAAAITPWNFPLAMVTRKVAPALAAGCTVVLKPASQTPLTAIAIAHLAQEAGLPDGVFNVITSKDSKGIGKLLSTNGKVRKLSFTGSTGVGKTLMQQAASTIKNVSFELGGNAPFLVFEHANIDAAVEGAIASKFRNSGQTCVAVNRFLVQDSIFDEFSKKLTKAISRLKVGNGLEKNIKIGPLINKDGLKKVKEHVDDAIKKGAKVLLGAKPITGLFYEPTVLTDVPLNAKIAHEETFGPVASLFRFDTEEEAIQIANDTEFGLAAYFYSDNVKQCWRVATALEAGMVGINEGGISTAIAPFGGVKESGLGREGSKYGLEEYMEMKYLCFGLE
ncbi:NAD-dependent succinate-semialdehyde dehydrogenase [Olivibacter sp. SDN3]|uniref:NAD-dependent succinate-semialdehyde dehydrogenase n=1 Tax=Olivibacter sp. SDN3 TaxID=2764720 RepID=UPI00165135C2|nr:NAD-dependent succinate-semialdehyde dehydrogenase [Olivibacter sp. SDN3]QNL50040.1 NAD-dependent succinate-semialdehyde dehydrogenase [Olivibacter sp. SDN3]